MLERPDLRKEKKEKKYQNPVKQNRQKREIREMGKVEIYYRDIMKEKFQMLNIKN